MPEPKEHIHIQNPSNDIDEVIGWMRDNDIQKLTNKLECYDRLLRQLPDREDMGNLEKRIIQNIYFVVIKSIKDSFDFLGELDEFDDNVRTAIKIRDNSMKVEAALGFADFVEKATFTGSYYEEKEKIKAWLEEYREANSGSEEVAATRETDDINS
ncbi:MAG: hypothetical protein FH756_00165 [Firmicutes bacterium]|nr:hypothetical protein [Bacillota bacterium]